MPTSLFQGIMTTRYSKFSFFHYKATYTEMSAYSWAEQSPFLWEMYLHITQSNLKVTRGDTQLHIYIYIHLPYNPHHLLPASPTTTTLRSSVIPHMSKEVTDVIQTCWGGEIHIDCERNSEFKKWVVHINSVFCLICRTKISYSCFLAWLLLHVKFVI